MMLLRLFLLLLIIPILELFILIQIGKSVGVVPTIALVIITAILGAYFTKREGLNVLRRMKQNLSMGVMPAQEILHGVLVLIAGVLLLTPGLITDLAGFLLLIPRIRSLVLGRIYGSIRHHLDKGPIQFRFFGK
jgi:UPF0716 protein FxsA